MRAGHGCADSRICAPPRSMPGGHARRTSRASTCTPTCGLGAHDRARREQVCRYLLRPPLADDRLRVLGDGSVPMHCIDLNTIIAVQMAMPGKLVTQSKGTRGVFGT